MAVAMTVAVTVAVTMTVTMTLAAAELGIDVLGLRAREREGQTEDEQQWGREERRVRTHAANMP